jgi:hypothetical protein
MSQVYSIGQPVHKHLKHKSALHEAVGEHFGGGTNRTLVPFAYEGTHGMFVE